MVVVFCPNPPSSLDTVLVSIGTRMTSVTRVTWMAGETRMTRMTSVAWVTSVTRMTGVTKTTRMTRMTSVA